MHVLRGLVPWVLSLLVTPILLSPVGSALPWPQMGARQSDTPPAQEVPSAQNTRGPSGGQQREPPPRGGGRVGAGVSLDLSQLFGHHEPDIEKTLEKKGPQFPDAFTMSNFAVQGF